MAAEGYGRARQDTSPLWLQWGRGRMAAEGRARRPRRPRPPARFNGAAAGWPRKGGPAPWALTDVNGLQWGRGRMAAEGLPAAPAVAALSHFNGAAAGWPRKVRKVFMLVHNGIRFNGAAAGWPRKAWPAPSFCLAARVASMGPRPDGRGRSTRAAHSASVGVASMGPRPDGRGRLHVQRRQRGHPPASMGPRPDGRGRLW